MAAWIKMSLGMELGLSPGDIVLNGDPAPPKKRGGHSTPPILAHIYFGQTVGWIKMKLGMAVGLGPGHIMLDGDPAPSPQMGTATVFGPPCLLWPNAWMDQDATCY